MDTLGQDNVNFAGIYNVLSSQSNLNKLTTYTGKRELGWRLNPFSPHGGPLRRLRNAPADVPWKLLGMVIFVEHRRIQHVHNKPSQPINSDIPLTCREKTGSNVERGK